MSDPVGPAPFPVGGKRLVIFTIYDRRGGIEEAVVRSLQGLRPFAAEIQAVINGSLSVSGRDVLEALVDEIVVRENRGYDIGAQQQVLMALESRIHEFDEILLTNDTWYGPVGSFHALFERMDSQKVDAWSMTEHVAIDHLPRHLQSYWLVARRSLTESTHWREYWRSLPVFDGYWDAVTGHELVFGGHFEQLGYTTSVAFPADGFPEGNYTIFAPVALLEAGCPIIKKRVFFHDPVHLARNGVSGREVLVAADERGLPCESIWRHLVRTVPPHILAASCGLVAETPLGERRSAHILATVFVQDESSVADVVARVRALPGTQRIVLTGTDPTVLERALAHVSGPEPVGSFLANESDVDGVVANLAALSVIDPTDFEAVLVLRSPRNQARTPSGERVRDRLALDALLGVGGGASAVDILLGSEGIGMVMPAPGEMGRGSRSRAWGEERPWVERLRDSVGIRVPWDDEAPLEPDAGMWVATPDALSRLLDSRARAAVLAASVDVRAAALLRALASAAGEDNLRVLTCGSPSTTAQNLMLLGYEVGRLQDRLSRIEASATASSAEGLRVRPRVATRVHRILHRVRSRIARQLRLKRSGFVGGS